MLERTGNIIAFPERRYGIRVGDLRAWHDVRVLCRSCGHIDRVPVHSLWRQCAMTDSVVHVMKRRRCKNCGGSSVKWDISQIERDG